VKTVIVYFGIRRRENQHLGFRHRIDQCDACMRAQRLGPDYREIHLVQIAVDENTLPSAVK